MTNPGPAAAPSDRALNLRDILVGESLIGAADQAERQDYYRFFGMGPMAPFSQLRAAYLAAWSQYGGARFEEYQLSPEALSALERLQTHIEEGYETLTNLDRRQGHNVGFGLDAEVPRRELERLFEAEELFKEAQIKLTDGDNGKAVELLHRSTSLNAMEPEYVAYLAWAITCASMWGQTVTAELPTPDKLLRKALRMDPRLESAWIFRARIAELSGDIKTALSSFVYALKANPDNEEAEQAVERLRAAGVELDPPKKTSLQDRLGGLLRREDSNVGPLPKPPPSDDEGDTNGGAGGDGEAFRDVAAAAAADDVTVTDPDPAASVRASGAAERRLGARQAALPSVLRPAPQRRELRGRGGAERDGLAGDRVGEPQAGGAKVEPASTEQRSSVGVGLVAQDRVADTRQMAPQLVGPPRRGVKIQGADVAADTRWRVVHGVESRDRSLAVERCIDRAADLDVTANQRSIGFRHLRGGEGRVESGERMACLGGDEQARRGRVQAVGRPRGRQRIGPRRRREVERQSVGDRAVPIAADGQARGLEHHGQLLVLVEDVEGQREDFRPTTGVGQERQESARANPARRFGGPGVDQHEPLLARTLGARATGDKIGEVTGDGAVRASRWGRLEE